jgi:MFS family permease
MLSRLADAIGVNRTVLALSVARFADALGNSMLYVIIPLYVVALPAPVVSMPETLLVGVLISLYGLTNSLFQPITGALTDRAGRRKPFILLGLFLMAGGTLAFLFADRYIDLIFIRILQGLGVALTIPASLALMTTSSVKRTRGGSMGLYSTMRVLGFGIGPLLSGILYGIYGFQAVFVLGAAFVLLSTVLVQVWVDESTAEVSRESEMRFRFFDREAIDNRVLGLGVATFFMACAFSMMTALENEFNARLQQTALGFGIAFSALTFTRLLVQLPLGRLSDRIGRKPLIVLGLLMLAPSTAMLGYVASTMQLTGVRAFQGLASAAIAAPSFALAGDLSQKGGEGRQMSIITVGFGLGIAIGPLIAGALATYLFQLPFLIGGLLSLFGAGVVLRFVPEAVGARATAHLPNEGAQMEQKQP